MDSNNCTSFIKGKQATTADFTEISIDFNEGKASFDNKLHQLKQFLLVFLGLNTK